MKNYDETINSVFERINEYEVEKKRNKRTITRTVVSLCLLCSITLIGIWQSGLLAYVPSTTPSTILENPTSTSEHDSPSLPETDTPINNVDDPMSVIYITSLLQESTGEFAADMYRPEGFNDNIGSVLAIKMSMATAPDYKFPVIVRVDNKKSLEQTINNINDILSEPIGASDVKLAIISGDESTSNMYYLLLTYDQITAFADAGAKCYYLGSGKGEYKDISWDTEEGINTYCELNGDMYVINSDSIQYSPDLYVD